MPVELVMAVSDEKDHKQNRKPARAERVKAALRANLQRRKQKARALKKSPDVVKKS